MGGVVRIYVLPALWDVNSTISHGDRNLFLLKCYTIIYVTQRITRMPRLSNPMKDVASCDKLRSAARQALPAEDFRMGKPHVLNSSRPDLTFVFEGLGECKI